MLKKILLYLLLCSSGVGIAQDILQLKLDGSEQGKSALSVLEKIGEDNNVRFYFISEWLEPLSFQQSYKSQTLAQALDNLFLGTDLSYLSMYPSAVVIIKDPTQAGRRNQAIQAAVYQKKGIRQLVFGEPGKSEKGKSITITGQVLDSKTNEAMQHATVQVSDTQYSTTTDESGKYSFSLTPGIYVLTFGYVEYEDQVIDLAAYGNGEINISLEGKPILLDAVVVREQPSRELVTSSIGLTRLALREMKHAPTMLGEVDLVKQVQTQPGVTTVGEAASGYNVRGGSVDQNLILYDGLPVFNSSHVFGFLSAFNSEAIRDVSFYRGGIPAEYGGRVSSVLDIRSKDGSFDKWNGNVGIGMITANIMVNGPLRKDKTSLATSFRSTYSNWLVHSIRTDYADLSNSSVFFYDGTIKLTHLFNERTKLSFTGYSSKDAFKLTGDSTYQWSSQQGSVRLDHQFTSKLNSEFVAGISSYGYSVINEDYLTASKLSYRITSSILKAAFIFQEANHKINFGWQLLHYRFNPGTLEPDSPESNARPISMNKQYSLENAFHVSDGWTFNEKLFIEGGIRMPMFFSLGSASVNIYKEGGPREITTITDTLYYKTGEPIRVYVGLEPRLSIRWMTSSTSSVKLGYNRMYQFLHLVTNTTAVTPVDIWQPSGYYFKPQLADQISIGYFKDFKEKRYGTSAEIFYKSINNILDFKDGAQLILNDHLETDLLQGKGYSYGVETSFNKNAGRLTGSLNYTYSRSFRLISGPSPSESINSGERYPSSFDQPHILNLAWKYNLSRRFYFTGNFTYHTGRPVTIPLSAFSFENTTVAYFSERNQYRIPDYHRIDVALVIEGSNKRKRRGEGTLVISVYNVYGRMNPYTVFFKSSGNGIPKPYQLSIIGTALPSISYNYRF